MRRHTYIFGAVCATAALTLCACGTGEDAGSAAPPSYTDVRNILQRLTTADGAPGALLEVREARGRTVLTSGVANVGTHVPMAGESRFRIGSMTKMFVATVVLQLVSEHRVELDAPVEQYLPGMIQGNGNDGHDITVRQLLQHTSGLPDYLDSLSQEQILKDTLVHHDPLELVQLALANPPLFPPGTGWAYSNTNYLLAGMLIEKVTGRPYGEEVDQRIIGPLGLRDTSVPGDQPSIPGVHPQGYAKQGDAGPIDLSEFNPSIAGSAGSMISSAADLNQFLGAIMNGRLLRPPELQEMMTTRPTGDSYNDAYGLGFQSTPLPCGGLYWGHDGGILGFETLGATTADGRTATMMANLDPGQSAAQDADMRAALATALCGSSPTKPKPCLDGDNVARIQWLRGAGRRQAQDNCGRDKQDRPHQSAPSTDHDIGPRFRIRGNSACVIAAGSQDDARVEDVRERVEQVVEGVQQVEERAFDLHIDHFFPCRGSRTSY